MDTPTTKDRVRRMMRAYEGPVHTVVGTGIAKSAPWFVASGPAVPDVSASDTIFEIGSITKVFTGILLCLLAEEGKVDPRAPLRQMSGDLADVPDWITPERLIAHTSGLPNIHMPLWKALLRPSPEGPYAEFRRADLLAWLHGRRGRKPEPSPRHAYSNLGVGLLSEAISMQEGRPFVDLLAEKIIAPLGLKDTTHHLGEARRGRFAQPRFPNGEPVLPWRFEALAGAGCLKSSAHDLARFASHVIKAHDTPETPLDRAICRSAIPLFGLGRRGRMDPASQCSGWMSMTLRTADARILHCTGGTAGSTCALYICPEKAKACAVLSNNGVAANLAGGIRLGWSNQIGQARDCFDAGYVKDEGG